MKFLYEYRTSDNAKHTGVISAVDREAAFAALKEQGIRPGFMKEAPGFFNKLLGKGKRWIAIGVLAAVLVVMFLTLRKTESRVAVVDREIDNTTRRQVIGDAEIIDEGQRTGWAGVFREEGDRLLAAFAIPGVPSAVRRVNGDALLAVLDVAALPNDGDGIEARQIKAIVAGMKQELREFLRDGGTADEYGRELVSRQEREVGYYVRAKVAVENALKQRDASAGRIAKEQSAKLRKIGVRPVVLEEVRAGLK